MLCPRSALCVCVVRYYIRHVKCGERGTDYVLSLVSFLLLPLLYNKALYGRTHVISRPPATQQIVSVYRQFSQSNPCTATVKIFALKKSMVWYSGLSPYV